MKSLLRARLDRLIDRRCEQIILSVLSILSSAIYKLPIDKSDFKVGAWTPLNINHENVVLKYIARSVSKSPAEPISTFIMGFGREVMLELAEAFDEFYVKEPVEAHNTAILYRIEITRLNVFLEVLDELGEADEIVNLAEWVGINPVETAESDWS